MSLKSALLSELSLTFSNVAVNFVIVEDSRHRARIYTLLVAHTSTDLRFGRDWYVDCTSAVWMFSRFRLQKFDFGAESIFCSPSLTTSAESRASTS